jgi:hypothetical protein
LSTNCKISDLSKELLVLRPKLDRQRMLQELPWDWDELVGATKDSQTTLDENDLIFQKVDNDTIKVAKINLRIKSVIFENASVEEIQNGYEDLKSFCEVDRVIKLLVESMIMRAIRQPNIQEFEPEVVDFVKICYWYNRIKSVKAIEHRTKELRNRLCRKLLPKLEKNKRTLDYSHLDEDEIQPMIEQTLKQIRLGTSERDRNEKHNLLNEYLNFFNVCMSEIMFPVLAYQSNYKIDFQAEK